MKILLIVLLLSGSIVYSFPSLHAEESSQQNARLLQACLDKADQALLGNFRVLCRTDDKINGGTEQGKKACYNATVEDAIGFMTISAYNRDVFDRILNQRKSDRADCFMQYNK